MATVEAKFSQSRNDLHWSLWAGEDGFVRWSGYDDSFWWDNISPKAEWRLQYGKSGTRYTLDPRTNRVVVQA